MSIVDDEIETPTKTKPWSTGAVMAALRERYAPPQYAFIAEVMDATGMHSSRAADGLAMSCWPSRGLDLTGFEIKVSRSDWLRELKNPAKAEVIFKYCDFWYIVTGAPGIVAATNELPLTWGLIEPHGKKLAIKVEAPRLTPAPMTRDFLAAILRRHSEQNGRRAAAQEEIQRAIWAGIEKGKKQGQSDAERENRQLKAELERLKLGLAAFERASGIQIDQWHGPRIGEAVKLIMSGGLDSIERQLVEAGRTAERIAERVQEWREAKTRMTEETAS